MAWARTRMPANNLEWTRLGTLVFAVCNTLVTALLIRPDLSALTYQPRDWRPA